MFTSDQVISAFQEEAEALRQALVETPDYRLAQIAMDRLEGLEGALWNIQASEARAAVTLSKQELEEAHKIERTALEADLKQKEDRLRKGCSTQENVLRQENKRWLAKLNRPVQSICQEEAAVTPGPVAMTPAIAVPQAKDRPELETEISDGVVGNKRFEEGALDRVSLSEKLTTVPAASATVVGHVRSREMIELRLELAKHLTLVYVDGGQHPQEATNIMRLVEELEAKVKLETEAKAQPGLGSFERAILQQKYARAEEVQRDKHDKLFRSLERSRTKGLRLLSVRHRGALARLAERCQDENRRRKQNLRERLVATKSGVTGAWREHNCSRPDLGVVRGRHTSPERGASPGEKAPESGAPSPFSQELLTLRRDNCDEKIGNYSSVAKFIVAAADSDGVENIREDKGDSEQENSPLSVPLSSGAGFIGASSARGGRAMEDGGCDGKGKKWKSVREGRLLLFRGLTVDTGKGAFKAKEDHVVKCSNGAEEEIHYDTDSLKFPSAGLEAPPTGSSPTFLSGAITTLSKSDSNSDAIVVDGGSRGTNQGGGQIPISDSLGTSFQGPCTPEADRDTVGADTNTKAGSVFHGNDPTIHREASSLSHVSTDPRTRTNRKGNGLGRRRKGDTVTIADAAAYSAFGFAPPSSNRAVVGGAMSILSEEEVQALAALGRGAPNDPRLLLLTSPSSSEAWAEFVRDKIEPLLVARDGGCFDGGRYDHGGKRADGQVKSELLDGAVDKLASEMQAEEELIRRRLGMAPLSSR